MRCSTAFQISVLRVEIEGHVDRSMISVSIQNRREYDVEDAIFLDKFGKENRSDSLVPRGKEPSMEEFVGIWINGGVQPLALIVEGDHGFVNRDVIWVFSVCWLLLAF